MKKLGLVLAVLVALNVSAFADLIVINKKDLVPQFQQAKCKTNISKRV
ncbi:TPA: hypothetical protein SE110_000678 [Campylobacter jejuni]|nr:GTP-binding protein [Campylobacter jejuni]HEE9537416.1 hypothetical protein [Campylobacter jejuni subsp. jejuni]EEP3586099.1 GTP-binding protein [Campylobacter jejuni]HBD8778769.1 hypothetical protein [Campylobacter jejuni]HBD8796801.1 hypothetical protein [Campylobacter jejuni]